MDRVSWWSQPLKSDSIGLINQSKKCALNPSKKNQHKESLHGSNPTSVQFCIKNIAPQ